MQVIMIELNYHACCKIELNYHASYNDRTELSCKM